MNPICSRSTAKRFVPWLILLLAAAIVPDLPAEATSPGALAAPPDEISGLAWLAGHWRGEDGEAVTEEGWLAPAGGLMLAVHREVRGGGRAFFEFLRIEQRDEGLVFVAQPMGRPPTEFPAVEAGPSSIVFENPEHDFPRRLIYHREGDTLRVRAEGEQKGAPLILTWSWTLQP